MKVVAAYLMAVLGGNTNPSADDIKDILSTVGADVDDGKIGFLLSEIEGRDINELIAAGPEKLSYVPSGDGVAVAVAATVGGGSGAASAPAAAEAKEDKAEESDEGFGITVPFSRWRTSVFVNQWCCFCSSRSCGQGGQG